MTQDEPEDPEHIGRRAAFRVAGIYAVVGVLWIFLSDRVIEWVAPDAAAIGALQTAKGWFYVIVTALLVFLLSRRYVETVVARQNALIESQRESAEKGRLLSEILATVPHGVFWKDENSTYLGCNHVFAEIVGLQTPSEIAGRTDADLPWASGQDEGLLRDERDILRTGRPRMNIEQKLRRWDGSERQVLTSKVPLRDEHARIWGLVGIFADVTELRQMEDELLEARKLESVGQLAGGIAHDFNNLLTAIMGNVSLARMDLDSNPARAQGLLAEAETACDRARELTQQLLTFSRGGAPARHPTSVVSLLRETAEFTLRGTNVEADVRCADDLRPVDADSAQISRVISNLVLNARQAMSDGGTVHIRAENAEIDRKGGPSPAIRITVRDAGPGIPPETLPRIFEPYYTSKPGGSGLGLAVAYRIVQNHDGRLTVDSTPGEGSTFTILLPGSTRQAAPGEADASPRPPAHRPAGIRRVLVVDDQAAVRTLAGRMLERLGCQPALVATSQAAVDAYQGALREGNPFAAVILDLTMPGDRSGVETLEALKAIDPDVRAIVSSGYAEGSVIHSPAAAGFAAAVSKPYNLHEMSRAMDAVLGEAAEGD